MSQTPHARHIWHRGLQTDKQKVSKEPVWIRGCFFGYPLEPLIYNVNLQAN